MPTETLSIEVVAELEQLKKSLQEAGNLTDKQAQGMVISLEKRIKAAENAAKGAAKASKDAAKGSDDLKKGLGSLAKIAASAGGSIGAMGAVAQGAGSGLAELAGALGPVGVTAGIAAGAALAVAYGTYQAVAAADAYVASAGPMLDHLRLIGAASGIPEGSIRSIEDYRDQTEALAVATEQAHVETAGIVATLLGPAKTGFTGAASLFGTMVGAEVEARDAAVEAVTGYRSLGDALEALASHGPLGAIVRVGQETRQANEDAKALTATLDAAQSAAEAEDARRQASAGRADAAAKAAEAQRRADAARARADQQAEQAAYRAVTDGVRGLRAQAVGYYADTLTPQQALVAGYDAEIGQIAAKTRALQDQLRAVSQLSTEEKVHQAARIRAAEAEAEAAAAARLQRDQVHMREQEQQQADAARADLMFQQELARQNDSINAAIEHGAAIQKAQEDTAAVAGLVAQQIGDSAEALTQFARAGSAGAKALLITQKAAGAASVVVASEVAKAQALAQLGPIAGAVAVAAITAGEVISLATIAAQTFGGAGKGGGGEGSRASGPAAPPQHPTGGVVQGPSPDHVAAYVQPGEGVVSHRGMQQLGADGLDRLNAGQGGGTTEVVLQYGPAQLGRVLIDTLRRPGEARSLVAELAGARAAVAGHRR